MKELELKVSSGAGYFLINLIVLILGTVSFVFGVIGLSEPNYTSLAVFETVAGSVLWVVWFIMLFGFFTLQPNEGAALILFGQYKGTVKKSGWHFANPFFVKRKISLRARNLNGEKLKVNDEMGNPIEIAAVVVWRVENTAEALFEVDNYSDYVRVQSESALRHLAGMYPYDASDDAGQLSLRGSADEVSENLRKELQTRLGKAGVVVEEARLSHLAYSPEIAAAMLQRQQAAAIIAARQKIVEGAVGMVHMALSKLSDDGIVTLDEEKKAAMVSNLLVVLCGERSTQPIVNTGSSHI